MRVETTDSNIDIQFDCGAFPATFKRADLPGLTHIRFENVTGGVSKTASGSATVPPGFNAILINRRGTLLLRTSTRNRLILVPPQSITYLRSCRLIAQAARGDHSCQVISWPTAALPFLEHWLISRNATRTEKGAPRPIATQPIDHVLRNALDWLDAATEPTTEVTEPLIVSFIFKVVPKLITMGDQYKLTGIPQGLPETMRELVAKVSASPQSPWPLKDAADLAGYSPFHFSRVFKNLVSYGFHEYVDRCRTEKAVEMLISSDVPVDVVAAASGFGTTQGLRESVKEYLGLNPSELRTAPDPVSS